MMSEKWDMGLLTTFRRDAEFVKLLKPLVRQAKFTFKIVKGSVYVNKKLMQFCLQPRALTPIPRPHTLMCPCVRVP